MAWLGLFIPVIIAAFLIINFFSIGVVRIPPATAAL